MSSTSSVNTISLTYMELYEKWFSLNHLRRNLVLNNLIDYALRKTNGKSKILSNNIENFLKNLEKRWKPCSRNRSVFMSKNKEWLKLTLSIEKENETEEVPGPSSRTGRPPKSFEDCKIRTKQLRARNLVAANSTQELAFATQVSLRKSGKRVAAEVVGKVTSPDSPKRAKAYKTAYVASEHRPIPLTPDEAVSLIVSTKSSKETYLAYRSAAKTCKSDIYPSWNKVLLAKQACYPDLSAITVSDTVAEINLENLLHLTARRICQLQSEVIKNCSSQRLTLLCKWGIDGSSGQSNYRQMVKSNNDDSSVLIISLVPIQLRDLQDKTTIIWQNPVPSSTRFCRPIKFIFCKETPEITISETGKVQRQIDSLRDYIHENEKSVSFQLVLTMVDGKVCHTLTGTKSTLSCYICKATPKEMNDLKNINTKSPLLENYRFGLSSLHSWIRFFECCLHIGYRIDIKCWQARKENRERMTERKNIIIERCRKELGILVDQPKPGYGSTNTGNTARTFFRNAEKAPEITGVDCDLIKRFHIILQVLSSGYEIDVQRFKDFSNETADKFVNLYPWYYMPTSVHKILIHGAEIINHSILPIGQLGEEAQESKNKDFKFVREHRTRKDTINHTNEDLLHYLILSSDPIISHIWIKDKRNKHKMALEPKALTLLKAPSSNSDLNSSDSE